MRIRWLGVELRDTRGSARPAAARCSRHSQIESRRRHRPNHHRAGGGRAPDSFDRWLALPEIHGELLGVVDCLDHIDAMLPDDESATSCRRPHAAAPKRPAPAKQSSHDRSAWLYAQCVQLRRQGLQQREISERLHCHIATVVKYLRRASVNGERLPARIDKPSTLATRKCDCGSMFTPTVSWNHRCPECVRRAAGA